jgi:hypothetical protein
MVNRTEILRRQLQDLAAAQTGPLKDAAMTLEKKLTDFEENLHQLRISGGQDGMRWPSKLLEKLGHLATEVQESDFRPTDQQTAVNQQFDEQIRALKGELDQLLNQDVAGFNKTLQERKLPLLNTSPSQGGRQ